MSAGWEVSQRLACLSPVISSVILGCMERKIPHLWIAVRRSCQQRKPYPARGANSHGETSLAPCPPSWCNQPAHSFRITLLCYQNMNDCLFISPAYFQGSAAVSTPYCLGFNLLCLCSHRQVMEALSKEKETLIVSVSSSDHLHFGFDSFSKSLLLLQCF